MNALLLIGPTGSGKTPLGALLEEHGFNGMRCLHFDFGQELRNAGAAAGFEPAERTFIRRVLEEGLLLEREHLPLAQKMLRAFLVRRQAEKGDWVILNGFPRHVEQAEAVDEIVKVQGVVLLECTAEVVYERIQLNSGGDRSGRPDDGKDLIAKKLQIYAERTAPLVAYYRTVHQSRLSVSASTTAEEAYTMLAVDLSYFFAPGARPSDLGEVR